MNGLIMGITGVLPYARMAALQRMACPFCGLKVNHRPYQKKYRLKYTPIVLSPLG
ncbi:hypothetical protein [Thalassospira profundimaris]|uniref:hypothetical protein n=1 Tax=Thalassospira profundimaris TaxID=502049 RepID=UPI0015F0F6C9|nr:hypothetical protein [Thalassospira profundimaris]